jgi:hypothetical protein
MYYSEYPKTDESCLAYARMVTANKGEVRHALRLAPNNPYGLTHAICGNEDLADYLENGCSLASPETSAPTAKAQDKNRLQPGEGPIPSPPFKT